MTRRIMAPRAWSVVTATARLCVLMPLLTACSEGPVEPATSAPLNPPAAERRTIPNQWIVTLATEPRPASGVRMSALASDLTTRHGGSVAQVFDQALRGFVLLADERVARAISREPGVRLVEQDVYTTLHQSYIPPLPWGLDRIDQRNLPLNGAFVFPYSGQGVHVYDFDSGIYAAHQEFTGRIGQGYNAVSPGGSVSDCSLDGHGTATASILGGTYVGVARQVVIHPILVTCGIGSGAQLIGGINWVMANRIPPSVINMSLGVPPTEALNQAIRNAMEAGIVVVASAGNDNSSACGQYPAGMRDVITVAASTIVDAREPTSNKGPCVDLFAPGLNLTAADKGAADAYLPFHQTSAAAPHVTGWAAQYLQAFPSASVSEVASAVIGNASLNKISNPGSGTPNRLLYEGFVRGVGVAVTGPSVVTRGPWGLNQYTWSATAQNGTGGYTYQWYWGCGGGAPLVAWTPISGATGSTLIKSDLQILTHDFYVGVTVTSAGFTAEHRMFVDVTNGQWPPGTGHCPGL